MFSKKGFTLVELMIVVAIIGILAAIAVPNFISMQHKAKRAELPANLDGIKTAQMAYDAAFDGYLTATLHPRAVADLDKATTVWGSGGDFAALGWEPDGEVRGTYNVVAGNTEFTAYGQSDVDNDNAVAIYSNSKKTNTKLTTGTDTY